MSRIEITEILSRREHRVFVDVPYRLRKSYPNWVLPFRLHTMELLNKDKHPFFKHANMRMFIAKKADHVVGRIAYINNAAHTQTYGDNSVQFGFFDCIDDAEVARALFERVEQAARDDGASCILGPFNHSVHDELGLQISGFETQNYVLIPGNPAYYPALVDACGYRKRIDLHCMRFPMDGFSDRIENVAKRIEKRMGLTVRKISKASLASDIAVLQKLYNDEWEENWPWVRITDAEMELLVENLLQIAELEASLIISDSAGEPIGFTIALPNINELFSRTPNGRLFPFGLIRLLFSLKARRFKSARVLAMGVRRDSRGKGVDSVMHYHQQANGAQVGFKEIELSQILETNVKMIAVAQNVGANIKMTHRIYEKQL